MNDNAELLKFAVENIEEWPEEWTHLRSDNMYNSPILTSGTSWFICPESIWSHCGDRMERVFGFKTEKPQVVSRSEWEESRKEYTIEITEEGAKRVFEGLENPPPTNPKLLEAAEKVKAIKTNTFTKSMLEAGKHVVITGDGKEHRVTKDRLVDYNDRYILLEDLDDNMSSIYPELSVVKVIEVTRTTIWSREDEEKVKEREMLKKEIDNLKAQLKEKEDKLEGLL